MQRFIKELNTHKQIAELAITPILLSLTCLLFSLEKQLPAKRWILYEKGVHLLLERWDEFRDISRDYQALSTSEKQSLLSYLAFQKFCRYDNFTLFEAVEIHTYISDYLGISLARSEAVLKTIEAHHGLLVERAQGIWSFSHLTFHEYFVAKYLVNNSDTEEVYKLAGFITSSHWEQVFYLVFEMS